MARRIVRPASTPRENEIGAGDVPSLPRGSSWVWDAVSLPSMRNLVVAIGAAALAAALGATLVLTRDAVYSSQAIVDLHTPRVFTETGPAQILKLNALRSRYAALVATAPITGPMAEKLGRTVPEIRDSIRVDIRSESLLMYPSARAPSAEDAQSLAQAAADQLVEFAAAEQELDEVPERERVVIRVLQPASEGIKIAPQADRAVVVASLAAGATLLVVYVILQVATASRRVPV